MQVNPHRQNIPARCALLILNAVLLLVTAGCSAWPAFADRETKSQLTVAAASDLQLAFQEIVPRFEEEVGTEVIVVLGSTGQLAQQIENGAPYDVFFAANVQFVEALREKGLILPETQRIYARGFLAVVVNRESGLHINDLHDLLAPDASPVAIANPDHAPYGMAAREALIHAGIWDEIQPKLVLANNVRAALRFVQTGDAPVGIVARAIVDVPEVTWTLVDETLHTPIEQAAAVVATSAQPELAQAFIEFVNGPQGAAILAKYGFQLSSHLLEDEMNGG